MLVLQAYAVCCNTSHTMVNKVALDPRRLTESAARSLMYFILIFLSRCLALIVACIQQGMPGMSCLSCLTGFCRRVPLWRALICSVFLEKMGWWRPIDFGQFPIFWSFLSWQTYSNTFSSLFWLYIERYHPFRNHPGLRIVQDSILVPLGYVVGCLLSSEAIALWLNSQMQTCRLMRGLADHGDKQVA